MNTDQNAQHDPAINVAMRNRLFEAYDAFYETIEMTLDIDKPSEENDFTVPTLAVIMDDLRVAKVAWGQSDFILTLPECYVTLHRLHDTVFFYLYTSDLDSATQKAYYCGQLSTAEQFTDLIKQAGL